jgi:hypothetical protein
MSSIAFDETFVIEFFFVPNLKMHVFILLFLTSKCAQCFHFQHCMFKLRQTLSQHLQLFIELSLKMFFFLLSLFLFISFLLQITNVHGTLIKGKNICADDTYITYHARGLPRQPVVANLMLYVKISPYASYCH